jgi:hypothetical protein
MPSALHNILLLYTDPYYRIKPVYPFGLDLIARHLRRFGYRATLGYPFLPHTDPQQNLKDLFDRSQPDLIGLGLRNLDTTMSCEPHGNFTGNGFQAFSFLADIRNLVSAIKTFRPGTPLIVGGGAFTIAPEAVLSCLGIDFGIAGEGEAALLRFARAYPNLAACKQIPNLVYKDAEAYRANPRDPYTFAEYGRFATRDSQFAYAYESAGLPVQTKRGCNRNCSYCVEPIIEGRRFTLRRPEDVVAELEALAVEQPETRTVFFVDTEFNIPDLGHCTAIVQRILDAALHQRFRFASQFLPRPFNPELADLLGQAGFALILTADSFSDTVLQENGVSYRQQDILQTLALCERFAIDCTVNLIFGLPGETWQTLDQTLATLQDHPPTYQRRYEYTCGARIYHGTPLWHRIAADPEHRNVYGRLSPGCLDPCFYCAPTSPADLKAQIDDRLAFTLDFQNDYDIVRHQTLAMGFLADQAQWHEAVTHFTQSDLKAQVDGYGYLFKKLVAADRHAQARAILSHVLETIDRQGQTHVYADQIGVLQYYMNLLHAQE